MKSPAREFIAWKNYAMEMNRAPIAPGVEQGVFHLTVSVIVNWNWHDRVKVQNRT